jgi:glutaminyl-peptide cyclotransferase
MSYLLHHNAMTSFPRPSFSLFATLLLALSLVALTSSCGGTQAQGSNDHGDPKDAVWGADGKGQDRAMEDLRYLCEEIGPRRIGTKGAEQTRVWMQKILGELKGWKVSLDAFEAMPPEGARRTGVVQGANILARRAGTQKGEIWIASHYDTFDTAGFVGANDGGSSTVVLLELARQLQGDGPRDGMTIVLCWFDGEELFPLIPWHNDTNSTFGSRSLAERMEADKTIKNIKALVLLDMIGDAKLGLLQESGSDSRLKSIFESTAASLGDLGIFVGQRPINDDHLHFRKRNVATIDLIDFNFGPGHSYWHTREDTLDKVSANSLARVGRLVTAALPRIEKEFGK